MKRGENNHSSILLVQTIVDSSSGYWPNCVFDLGRHLWMPNSLDTNVIEITNCSYNTWLSNNHGLNIILKSLGCNPYSSRTINLLVQLHPLARLAIVETNLLCPVNRKIGRRGRGKDPCFHILRLRSWNWYYFELAYRNMFDWLKLFSENEKLIVLVNYLVGRLLNNWNSATQVQACV